MVRSGGHWTQVDCMTQLFKKQPSTCESHYWDLYAMLCNLSHNSSNYKQVMSFELFAK